jgi:hypothetical protein
MVTVPGAEKFSSTIAMAETVDLRASRREPFRVSFSVSRYVSQR